MDERQKKKLVAASKTYEEKLRAQIKKIPSNEINKFFNPIQEEFNFMEALENPDSCEQIFNFVAI